KQRDRAQKTALANRLRPFIEEAKTRRLSWANRFDTHLEIPEAPRVEFAEGKFKLFSNLALLGELEKILGQNVVRDTLSTRLRFRPLEVEDRWQRVRDDGLTSYDLDEESPAQRLEKEQRDRAQKTALANKLKPFIEEAKTRRLSWANRFDTHLEIPEAPRVEFAEGKFSSLSNQDLLDKVIEIIGAGRTTRMLSASRLLRLYARPELEITEEEASKIMPFLTESNRRHLSWGTRIERFMPTSEISRVHPKIEEPEKEDVLENPQITALEAKLKTTYGIKIKYGKAPSIKEYTATKPTNPELIKDELTNFLNLLKKYPPNIRKRFQNITVYLAIDLKRKGKATGGVASSSDSIIIIDLSDGIEWALDHEFFHILDGTDGLENDNPTWAKTNPHGMADYVFKNGEEAIAAGHGTDDITPPEGFARTYGKKGGPDEDQATGGQSLLNPVAASSTMRTAKTDRVLRNKIEIITGCLFDPAEGRFTRQLTRAEYQARSKFQDFQYFAKWSRTKAGTLTMDPSFWNAIASGSPKQFE
ncbi:MAG: hypothetical protein WCX95_04040, partial [Candidatus Gracilibacteria bacterium]